MDALWYSHEGERKGPVDADKLRELSARGTVDAGTLVWRQGMEEWAPLGSVPELKAMLSTIPPALPKPSPRDEIIAMPLAGPWRRFWARLIDIWVISVPLGLVTGFIAAATSESFFEWMQQPASSYWLGWLLLPAILFAEAIVFAMTGTTLGKALLGVKVVTIGGGKPSFGQYLQRLVGVYWYGLGTGFPFVSLFTMARQHRHLKAGSQAGYDQGSFNVKASKLGVLRWVVVALCVFGILVLNALLQQIGRS